MLHANTQQCEECDGLGHVDGTCAPGFGDCFAPPQVACEVCNGRGWVEVDDDAQEDAQ